MRMEKIPSTYADRLTKRLTLPGLWLKNATKVEYKASPLKNYSFSIRFTLVTIGLLQKETNASTWCRTLQKDQIVSWRPVCAWELFMAFCRDAFKESGEGRSDLCSWCSNNGRVRPETERIPQHMPDPNNPGNFVVVYQSKCKVREHNFYLKPRLHERFFACDDDAIFLKLSRRQVACVATLWRSPWFCRKKFNSLNFSRFFSAIFSSVASPVRGWLHMRFSPRAGDATI